MRLLRDHRPGGRALWAGRLLGATIATAALAGLTGCDLQENADLDKGEQLFTQKCGTCHTLTGAGTSATVGPNLDAAFAGARASGMDQDTIEGVVESQIENPRVTETDSPSYMPANLVEGDDARDVAAYVAEFAGVPGVEPPIPPGAGPGAQVFLSQGCGSCHTLAALGDIATGTVGPDLDDVLPGMSKADIERSIVDPNADVEQGFPSGVMPDTYGDLPSKDIKELVDYLSEVAGQKQPAP
jgi:mono/diheme cytochrome c family protein